MILIIAHIIGKAMSLMNGYVLQLFKDAVFNT